MLRRPPSHKQIPLNIVGSSAFGRYPKISSERTQNMFISDGFLVDYPGYQVAVPMDRFVHGGKGRGCHTSTKLGKIITVVGAYIYLVNIFFDQDTQMAFDISVTVISTSPMATSSGKVYITENNTPQITVSDGVNLYVYDPNNVNGYTYYLGSSDGAASGAPILFKPGFVDFHDTYTIVAATNDTNYTPPANNTWYLSQVNPSTGKLFWEFDASTVGLIQTKPDNTQAVVRFPSHGNMVLVMGSIVTEPWGDQGLQLFPYVRSTAYSFDYGCINPATIAATDEIVVWLAQNEKSGPIICYTRGQSFEKITTDGIDYLFSQLSNPADSEAWIIRQDGHLIYHINFYTDNLSLFYDFNTKKFFHASDEDGNYFIASSVVFFNNQYYFTSKNNGNMYAFDTIYTTYDDMEIPRIRICANARLPTQEYFIANDVGFTIEQGDTPGQKELAGALFLITQDGQFLVTQHTIVGAPVLFITQDSQFVVTQDGNNLTFQASTMSTDFSYLIDQNPTYVYIQPRVDLSISIDGGRSFGNDMPYVMNRQGLAKNKIQWWQLGAANDFTCQFKFCGLGRFVATDGVLNIRQ